MLRAKDLMSRQVVTVGPDDTIDRALDLMVAHRISGLPVVDAEGLLLGILSEFDLLELICEGGNSTEQVSQYASAGLFTVLEEDSWVDVADRFRAKHVRRLPVLRGDKLVGIVTRRDLMRAIRDVRQRVRQEISARTSGTSCSTGTEAISDARKGSAATGELGQDGTGR